MLIFISGGVRSGKSTLGENYADSLARGRKVYIATAQICDDEMRERVLRHRQDRENKGYTTYECPKNLQALLPYLKPSDTVLLDCLGNLLANEMFCGPESEYEKGFKDKITAKILKDLVEIDGKSDNLIVISNEIFSDGVEYDRSTMLYMEILGKIHIKLAQMAEKAIECSVRKREWK